MKLRILGSGTSSGVPRIGGDWGACDPGEPRNRRTRVSLLVEEGDTRILVDTSPDMRAQLLAGDVGTVDAIIWTHEHADHVFGIDDIRQISHLRGTPVPGYARPATRARLESMFGYVFHGRHGYPATCVLADLPDKLTIGPITVRVTDQPHGAITSAGLRFESGGRVAAFATDFNEMTVDMHALYQGLDVWIVDALRRRPHPTHPHLDQVLEWVDQLRPGRTALIHMDQSMDYASLRSTLPADVEPGYDGLEFSL